MHIPSLQAVIPEHQRVTQHATRGWRRALRTPIFFRHMSGRNSLAPRMLHGQDTRKSYTLLQVRALSSEQSTVQHMQKAHKSPNASPKFSEPPRIQTGMPCCFTQSFDDHINSSPAASREPCCIQGALLQLSSNFCVPKCLSRYPWWQQVLPALSGDLFLFLLFLSFKDCIHGTRKFPG